MQLFRRDPWRQAASLADLGDLTARWLEGDITLGQHPGGYDVPDPETAELVPILARLNRAGLVTDASQPGDPLSPGHGGVLWRQCAAVTGLWSPREGQYERLYSAAIRAGLILLCRPLGTWRSVLMPGVIVTERDGQPHTDFGAQLRRGTVRNWVWPGLDRDVYREIYRARLVAVVDPEWGRNDRLWPWLGEQIDQGVLGA